MENTEIQRLGDVWRTLEDGRERLDSLLEIYATAIEELRAMDLPEAGALVATLETLYARTSAEVRYWDASQHAQSFLSR
jgi:hypothetical protein